jgi:hypothetical protein
MTLEVILGRRSRLLSDLIALQEIDRYRVLRPLLRLFHWGEESSNPNQDRWSMTDGIPMDAVFWKKETFELYGEEAPL